MKTTKVTFKAKLNRHNKKFKAVIEHLQNEKNFDHLIVKPLVQYVRETGNRIDGTPMPELKDSAIEFRERVRRNGNNMHREYQKTKPNLTISGRFLNSFRSISTRTKRFLTFRIDARDTHAWYIFKGDSKRNVRPNKRIRDGQATLKRDPFQNTHLARKKISLKLITFLRTKLFRQ
jgi:hypothetical protein